MNGILVDPFLQCNTTFHSQKTGCMYGTYRYLPYYPTPCASIWFHFQVSRRRRSQRAYIPNTKASFGRLPSTFETGCPRSVSGVGTMLWLIHFEGPKTSLVPTVLSTHKEPCSAVQPICICVPNSGGGDSGRILHYTTRQQHFEAGIIGAMAYFRYSSVPNWAILGTLASKSIRYRVFLRWMIRRSQET